MWGLSPGHQLVAVWIKKLIYFHNDDLRVATYCIYFEGENFPGGGGGGGGACPGHAP